MTGFLLILLTIVPPVSGQSPGPIEDPSDAVFQVVTYDREPDKDGDFRAHGFGTGFFISPDGTALTASHVVYLAAHDPARYRLLGVVGKQGRREFYDVKLICSTKLPYDPSKSDTNQAGVPYTKDVAEIKLEPSTAFEGRKETLSYLLTDGTRLAWAKAHTGALPPFPFLTVGGSPERNVRVIGFGAISPLPYEWTADGNVGRFWTARDGTPLFDVVSQNPPQPGDSGSPVLNDKNEVVGIFAWRYYQKPDTGTAQGNTILIRPCP
jgi:V8-like Glu-specific endopeptidase